MLNKKILRTSQIVLMISLCLICWSGVGLAVDDIHNGVGNMTGLAGSCEECGRTGHPPCIGPEESTCTVLGGVCITKTCGHDCPATIGIACDFTGNPSDLCTPGVTSCGGVWKLQCSGLGVCWCGTGVEAVDCGDRAQCN